MSESAPPSSQRFSPWLFLRSLIGFTFAPIIGSAAALAASGVHVWISQPDNLFPFAGFDMSLRAASLFGIPAALVLGWPAHLLMLRLRWTHWLVYTALGSAFSVFTLWFILAFILRFE